MASEDPKIEAIDAFFAAYASYDLDQMRKVLADDIEWTIPGHHPLSGTKRGVEEVAAFFTQLGKAGFQADPLFLEANDEYVVDVHRGWTTEGVGQVDTVDNFQVYADPAGHPFCRCWVTDASGGRA
jgi:ketosteroid isomerase-like protein